MLRWLCRWRERDDQHLVKRAAPLPADPIDELCRIINEAQERDAETNAGYIVQCGVSVLCLFNDGGPIAGDVRVAKDAGGQVSPTHEGDMSRRLGPQRCCPHPATCPPLLAFR